ncbi:MAG: flagellar export protein FliJ [Gammaproteobacteria bacterium]|nr:MAG: flagellar export protein FliJ [Gammaproteobacteria bacterium]
MSTKQLDTLLKYERDKEQKSAQLLQESERDYQDNLLRLTSVSDFRLEYMKRVSQRSLEGIDSATYSQYHAFIAKLDNASEQVKIAINQAKALVEQRKKQWLIQHQKVQAVELLRGKQLIKLAAFAAKQEQKMFDEIATQQYIRRSYS